MDYHKAFSKLHDQERQALLGGAERRTFETGEFVLIQKQPQEAVWVVAKGEVRVVRELRVRATYVAEQGQEARLKSRDKGNPTTMVELARLGEGEIFGEMSFVDHTPASASVIAAARSELLRIDGTAIYRLMREDPTFASRFYHSLAVILSQRLRTTSGKILHG